MKRTLIFLLVIALPVAFVGCNVPPTTTGTATPSSGVTAEFPSLDYDYKDTGIMQMDGALSEVEENSMEHPIALIILENGSQVELELYPEKAPETVANFIYLANDRKLYDNLTFHRIIAGFMVQGGDPSGDGSGGPGYTIKGEFAANSFQENNIAHEVGVISMARRTFPYDSAGSQFFICVDDCRQSLDGQYAAFGKVIKGMDAVLEMSKVRTSGGNAGTPYDRQGIQSIRVDTRGKQYDKPAGAK